VTVLTAVEAAASAWATTTTTATALLRALAREVTLLAAVEAAITITLLTRLGDLEVNSAAAKCRVVSLSDTLLGIIGTLELDEAEALVALNHDVLDPAELGAELLEVTLCNGAITKATYKDACVVRHSKLPRRSLSYGA
jgi:hypothetical protein